MTGAVQGCLLGLVDDGRIGTQGPPRADPRPAAPGAIAGAVTRRNLSAGAWVDLLPGWMREADALFARLCREVDWVAEERWMYQRRVAVPRLVRFYDRSQPLPDPALEVARDALSAHYAATGGGEAFTTAGLCLYRDGRDSVAWHGDRIGRSATQDTMVAIVSLGAVRTLQLRPRGGGLSLRFALGHGDLLVMGGSCQRTWDHAVPKTTGVGPRISVQFRQPGVR
ncbi:MAG TPA: alpha-ketoglutarate-dependent dioxygenase AlkB [Dermatophilaceae bacterium]|nr:alpha-ketoglutarate-dependent dioxygenase AlkB [Dermatophilaceae bacterium]